MKTLTLGLLLSASLILAGGTVAQQLVIEDTVCDVDLAGCAGGVQGLRGARSVAVSPDGGSLYFASSLDDALVALARNPLGGAMTHVQSLFDGVGGVDGLDSARGVAVSPDGAHVYVAALLDASVAAFARNPMTGALTFLQVLKDNMGGVDGLAGAHGVAVSPDGRQVYVASRSDDAVAAFTRNPATGLLTFLEAEFDNIAGVDGLNAAEAVTVSPDGAHVYVAAEEDNAVAVFARDSDTGSPDFGKLDFVEAQFDGFGGVDGLEGAGAVAVSPNGDNVYVGSLRGNLGGIEGDDWLAAFVRNPATGALSFVQALDENQFGTATTGIFAFCTGVGNESSGVAVRPDGQIVYLTNPFFGTVAAFDRAPATGTLTLAASICDLSFGADGLAGAVAVTTSPDGRSIYTASPGFQTVAALTQAIFNDGFESGDTSAWN